MTTAERILVVAGGAILVRQLFILGAVIRSAAFLRQDAHPAHRHDSRPRFFVVVPALREARLLGETVTYLKSLVDGHDATLVVVTTERELVDVGSENTVGLARSLADAGEMVHVHYPEADGLKGDQLNFAAHQCAAMLGATPPDRAFLVCYDADSRPPADSLDQFAAAASRWPDVSVFHQSSRFEARPPAAGRPSVASWPSRWMAQSAALRANRFVLGFELPRLRNRSQPTNRLKRWLSSYVYAHVTGHGLCLRLSLLLALPFPARSPLEDMHYSFHLGSRNIPMVAVPSLDCAEVPTTVRQQVRQAARWIFGPARFIRYLRDPATQPGLRAMVLAASALGSVIEWVGCAVVPGVVTAAIVVGPNPLRAMGIAVATAYLAQLVTTDAALGSPDATGTRTLRVLWCPAATTAFGLGGLVGLTQLVRGGSGVGKTERR